MKINLEKIKKTAWYRQETDSLNYFILGPAFSVLRLFRAGQNLFYYCKRNNTRAYFNEENFLRLARSAFVKYKHNTRYFKNLHRRWRAWNGKLDLLIDIVRKTDLGKISDQKLLSLNKKLGKYGALFWQRPFFMDIFDTNAESFIENELIKNHIMLKPAEMTLLLHPESLLVGQQYNRALRGLAKLQKPPAEAIQRIVDKFYFITCGFGSGKGLSRQQVLDDLKTFKTDCLINIAILLKQKKQLIKRLRLPKHVVSVFELFAFLTVWRDERKQELQKTVYALSLLGHEIAARSKMPFSEISVCPPTEISNLPVPKSLIKKYNCLIKNNFLHVFNPKKRRVEFLNRRACDRLMKLFEPKYATKPVSGQVASSGEVRGKVKIVLGEKDFHKFHDGDILISVMTRPEFTPLMRKAAAIITDEGGITSHAAIVSRELGIPCIIGTKIATRIFKDGDSVFVDAKKGIITKEQA